MAFFTDVDKSFSLDFGVPHCHSPYLRVSKVRAVDGDDFVGTPLSTTDQTSHVTGALQVNGNCIHTEIPLISEPAELVKREIMVDNIQSTVDNITDRVNHLCHQVRQLTETMDAMTYGFELVTLENDEDDEDDDDLPELEDDYEEDKDLPLLDNPVPSEDKGNRESSCKTGKQTVMVTFDDEDLPELTDEPPPLEEVDDDDDEDLPELADLPLLEEATKVVCRR